MVLRVRRVARDGLESCKERMNSTLSNVVVDVKYVRTVSSVLVEGANFVRRFTRLLLSSRMRLARILERGSD